MRLLLIDGHYYVYRSFHAIQTLTNSRGEPTNAIYGFVKTVRKMVKDLQPERAAVFWDEGLPEKRLLVQPKYKEQREPMPPKMIPQLDYIRVLCDHLGIVSIAKPNTEADDLMACYVKAGLEQNYEIILATNDKDLFQLVNEQVWVYSTNKTDLKSPKDAYALLGVEEVSEKWGVPPVGIGEVLALTGDSVDNIPGIEGIGHKTAASLIREFGTIENLLLNLDRVTGSKIRTKLESAREQMVQNREMVRLDLDHCLTIPIEGLGIRPDYPRLLRALEECEFKSLLEEVRQEANRSGAVQGELFS